MSIIRCPCVADTYVRRQYSPGFGDLNTDDNHGNAGNYRFYYYFNISADDLDSAAKVAHALEDFSFKRTAFGGV